MILHKLMKEKIEPFLEEIVIKSLDNNGIIYSCVPKKGIRMIPLGYFKTEEEAVEAFYNELVKTDKI